MRYETADLIASLTAERDAARIEWQRIRNALRDLVFDIYMPQKSLERARHVLRMTENSPHARENQPVPRCEERSPHNGVRCTGPMGFHDSHSTDPWPNAWPKVGGELGEQRSASTTLHGWPRRPFDGTAGCANYEHPGWIEDGMGVVVCVACAAIANSHYDEQRTSEALPELPSFGACPEEEDEQTCDRCDQVKGHSGSCTWTAEEIAAIEKRAAELQKLFGKPDRTEAQPTGEELQRSVEAIGLRIAAQLIYDMSEFWQRKPDGLAALADVRRAILTRAGRDPNEQGASTGVAQAESLRRNDAQDEASFRAGYNAALSCGQTDVAQTAASAWESWSRRAAAKPGGGT